MADQQIKKPVSALQRLAQQASRQAEATQERCDLCSEPIPHHHRHLLDLSRLDILCACRPCSILFDQQRTSQGKYRLVPDRCVALENFHISDTQWDRMRIPVGIAFFLYSTSIPSTHPGRQSRPLLDPPDPQTRRDAPSSRSLSLPIQALCPETRPSPEDQQVVVFYPSPLGPTESLLESDGWAALEQSNPELLNMEPDVEALLVNRARGARQYFIVPVDECYRLVGIVRLHWKGLSGGQEVWREIERFFGALRLHATRSHKAM